MPASSDSLPLFEQTCLEVLLRLEEVTSTEAMLYRRSAQELLDTLRSWSVKPPEPANRTRVIQAVLELHRRAMELVTSPHPTV